jgi:hypothetical protein
VRCGRSEVVVERLGLSARVERVIEDAIEEDAIELVRVGSEDDARAAASAADERRREAWFGAGVWPGAGIVSFRRSR